MKKRGLLAVVIGLLFLFGGCVNQPTTSSPASILETPVNIRIENDWLLFDTVMDATAYELLVTDLTGTASSHTIHGNQDVSLLITHDQIVQLRLRALGENTMQNSNYSLPLPYQKNGISQIQGNALDESPLIDWMGRTALSNDKVFFYYTASGFEVHFYGTKLTAVFTSTYATNAVRRPYLSIQLDGETNPWNAKVVALTASPQEVVLAEGLELGHHVVRVYKRSESSQSATALNEIYTDGYLIEKNTDQPLKIEFIGDSLTCGFGNLGKSGAEAFRTETEDGLLSYASLTARMLDADFHIVAVSGIGMYISPYASVNMGVVYPKTDIGKSTPWDHRRFVPDVIVVNLGANDDIYINSLPYLERAAAIEAFRQAYLAFTIALRGSHPNALIVLVIIPSWLDHLRPSIESVASQLTEQGDSNIITATIHSGIPTDGMGSSFHPTYKTHIRQADDLTAALEQALGIVRVVPNIPLE
jgi:lysophospholipase L1-like esterase